MDLADLVAIGPQEAVSLGAQSLTKYGKLFFPRTFRQDSAIFHEDVGRALYSPARFNPFEVFRGGAKTTLLRVYTSQRAAYGISRVIMYVSISQAHSIFSVRWLRRQVMYNTKWANTFGLRRGSKWTDEWAEIECHLLEDPEWSPLCFGCFDEKGESRWPARYPTDVLMRSKEAHVRRSQYRLWMREWEGKIVSGEEKAIDITRFKMYDVLPETLDTVISLDPASSENPDADEFAIAAVGMKGPDVYVLDYSTAKAVMPDKAANDTFSLGLLYSPRKIVVESNSYQRIMAWYLEQEMMKRRMFYAVERLEVKTKNSDRIMQTIPGLAAFGHFHIRPTHTKFLQQADEYDPS